ncbi:MAG: hypothetical protein HYX74_07605 [Acidobacteria bacterium]|nr:hypothetical protein [Acidobacteriota bacterium]
MRRRLFWITGLLLLLVVAAGGVLRTQWREYRRTHGVSPAGARLAPAAGGEKAAAALERPETPTPEAGEYNAIFERNLFSPSRTEFEPAEVSAEVPATPPLPGMPVLNGVSVVGDKKIAFIQEPRPGANPQSRSVQVGDTVMGFGKIKEIRSDALVFSWGDTTHTVELLGGDASRARTPTVARLQTTVITVGSKAAAPAGTPTPVPAGASPTIQIGSVGAAAAPGQGNIAGGAARGGNIGNRPAAAGTGAAPAQLQTPTQQQNPNVIDTPFGRVVRPQRR